MREFWRKQPKWLWAIGAGAMMIELGAGLISLARRAQREEVLDEQAEEP